MRRDGAWLGMLLATLVALWVPARAGAEEEGARFSWRPSLRFSTVADDNPLLEDGGDGSVGFWLAPRIELGYRGAAFEVGADLGVDARRYIDHSNTLKAELWRAVGWAEVGLRPDLRLRVSNAYVPNPMRVGLPEDESLNLLQTNRAEVDLRWWRELPGGRELKIGAVGTWFITEDYAETVPAAGGGVMVDDDFRADYLQGLGFIELQNPLAERTSGYVRAQFGYREFTDASSSDHTNLSLLLGVRSNVWSNVDFELAGGVGALGFHGFADELRALARLSLRHRIGAGWSWWLTGRQLFSPNLALQEASETTGEIGLEKRFGAATAAELRIFATRFDGDLRSGDPNLFGAAEVSVRHQFTRHLQVGLAYRHWANAGRFGLDDFSQNRIKLDFTVAR